MDYGALALLIVADEWVGVCAVMLSACIDALVVFDAFCFGL